MEIEVHNIPHIPDKGTHKVYFDPSDLYIDASDFKEVYMYNITLCILNSNHDLSTYGDTCT